MALDASKELTTTLMLLPFNSVTLSSKLWATTNGESLDFTAAAPYAALLVLLGIVPVYLLVWHTLKQVPPAKPSLTDIDGDGPVNSPLPETREHELLLAGSASE